MSRIRSSRVTPDPTARHRTDARRDAPGLPSSHRRPTPRSRPASGPPGSGRPRRSWRGRQGQWRSFLGARRLRIDSVLGDLLAQGVAIDAQDLGGPDLIAPGLAENGAQQRLFDERENEVVELGAPHVAQPTYTLH